MPYITQFMRLNAFHSYDLTVFSMFLISKLAHFICSLEHNCVNFYWSQKFFVYFSNSVARSKILQRTKTLVFSDNLFVVYCLKSKHRISGFNRNLPTWPGEQMKWANDIPLIQDHCHEILLLWNVWPFATFLSNYREGAVVLWARNWNKRWGPTRFFVFVQKKWLNGHFLWHS